MYIAKVKFNSHAEGPRANTTFWAAGCSLRCPGCFNPDLWEQTAGRRFSLPEILTLVSIGAFQGSTGVAFVGGEPFDQPWALLAAAAAIKLAFPQQVITLYSGYALEELLRHPARHAVLWLADLLVDGRFEARLAKALPNFRGSANQRAIRLKPTRRRLFRRIVDVQWDRLVAFSGQTVSAPPQLADMAGLAPGGQVTECGKF